MRYGFVAHLRVVLVACAVAAVSLVVFASGASAATFNVKNTAELEAAVVSANGNSAANTIVLAGGSYVPVKTLALTNTSGVQTIEGPTSAPSVKGTSALISGSSVEPTFNQLFIVNGSVSATIKNLEIGASGGLGTSAIEDIGSLTIENTTLEGNTGNGVLVTDKGTLTARNSTISDGSEFGVLVDGTASFFNSTIAFNADGGIQNVGTLNLTNTIVAENQKSGDCVGAATTSDHSLDSNGSCHVGALSNTNPLLQANLLNNGGSTPVHSLKPGSPAIGAGDEAECPTTDQRGAKRANPCSIGAVEFGAPPTITVPSNITTPATSGSGALVSYTATATASEELLHSFSCTPASGSTFPIGTTEVKCTAVAGDENTVTAAFKVQVTTPKHTLTVTVTGEGTVTSTPAGIQCGQGHTACSAEFEEVPVTLTPAPASGYTLAAWGGACTGTGSCSINPLSANGSVTASFSSVPVNTVLPVVSGTPYSGQTLSTTNGTWTGSPTSYTYQWEDCNSSGTSCTSIAGATSTEYTLTGADIEHTIRVVIVAHNGSGPSAPAESAATAVVTAGENDEVHGEVPFEQKLTSNCHVGLGQFYAGLAGKQTHEGECSVIATSTAAESRLTAEDKATNHEGLLPVGTA
jgi:Divergent InlB B-repeat domain/HYR domain/Right handed beta helix region